MTQDKNEWGFNVPPDKVDLPRLRHELINVPTIYARAYFQELKKKAPITYSLFKAYLEDNNLSLGCLKVD